MKKAVRSLFEVIICLIIVAPLHGANQVAISIVNVETGETADSLYLDGEYEIQISLSNDVKVGAIQGGFEISSTSGATWNWLSQPAGYGPYGPGTGHGYLTALPNSRMIPTDQTWDLTDIIMIEKNMDGIPPDSVLIGMSAEYNGMEAGQLDPMLALHFSPQETGQGTDPGTFCVVIAFIPPAGEFIFSNSATGQAIYPEIIGTACWPVLHPCPYDADLDGFGDPGHPENICPIDNCPDVANPDQADADGDGIGDACDICPGFDDNVDSDGDGIADGCDQCPGYDDHLDIDGDGVPDGCDKCLGYDDSIDSDGDGIPDGCDQCPGYDDKIDSDGDGKPDGCDRCPGFDDYQDADHDGYADSCDNCPEEYNYDQLDSDGDGIGDVCDYVCGDANGNGRVNINDLSFIIFMVFYDGPMSDPPEAADANCDGSVNVVDASYLLNYIFLEGPAPCCPDKLPANTKEPEIYQNDR